MLWCTGGAIKCLGKCYGSVVGGAIEVSGEFYEVSVGVGRSYGCLSGILWWCWVYGAIEVSGRGLFYGDVVGVAMKVWLRCCRGLTSGVRGQSDGGVCCNFELWWSGASCVRESSDRDNWYKEALWQDYLMQGNVLMESSDVIGQCKVTPGIRNTCKGLKLSVRGLKFMMACIVTVSLIIVKW